MHQRKGKKILIYFFLLLLVGSINNHTINGFKFEKLNSDQNHKKMYIQYNIHIN
mgnify:CR=1 FL=1